MTGQVMRFPFVERDPALGAASLAPLLPLTLAATRSIQVLGFLDTAATINVFPRDIDGQPGRIRGASPDRNRAGRFIRSGSTRVRVDANGCRPVAPWASEFLHGIRCLLLSFAVGIRDSTEANRGPILARPKVTPL
jgi:hypothetical protein